MKGSVSIDFSDGKCENVHRLRTRRRQCYETAKKLCSVMGSLNVHRLRTRRRKCYEIAKKLYPVKGSVHVHRLRTRRRKCYTVAKKLVKCLALI